MAHGAGHSPPAMGTAGFTGTECMALSLGNLRLSGGTEVDATDHRFAQAKSGEPMTRTAITAGASNGTVPGKTGITEVLRPSEGYDRWAVTYDSALNPLLALEERCVFPLLPALQNLRVLDLACGTG